MNRVRLFSLSKHVGDLKDKAFKEFMSPIDRDQLPECRWRPRRCSRTGLQASGNRRRKPLRKNSRRPRRPRRTAQAHRGSPPRAESPARGHEAAADSPQAFTAAVQKAGYVLASGDRGYTVVDENGGAYNLARQLKLKLAEINEFMAPIDFEDAPQR